MLDNFLLSLRSSASNDPALSRRRSPRREEDRCVVVINGQTFPVENWSFGGILVSGDDRMFGTEQDVEFTLKFKLRNTILDITHRGHIVRKGNRKFAVAFESIGKTIARCFQQVVDDAVAREFANSQV